MTDCAKLAAFKKYYLYKFQYLAPLRRTAGNTNVSSYLGSRNLTLQNINIYYCGMEIEHKYTYRYKYTQDGKCTWSCILDEMSQYCFKS
jgi:hypothetical protein